MMPLNFAIQVKGITKRFKDIVANDCIDFCLQEGEIHALLGENGAGKSTLMNIICGLYMPDAGEIYVAGQRACIRGPHDAIRLGIGMVHQHFMLVPNFSVTENILLGAEVTRGILLDFRKAGNIVRKLCDDYGLKINPDAIVENLPVGLQQRVEIMKALYRQARILVLDEPTAVLTPQEVEAFFHVMRRLVARGVSIIFITHKLKEVLNIADRISVMRRGGMIGTVTPAESDETKLARMMVGHSFVMHRRQKPATRGETLLRVQNLTVLDERKVAAVRDVSFEIRSGEIFGLAGIQGNGQTELAGALCGLLRIEKGTVQMAGRVLPALDPRALFAWGLAHIPEDRLRHGLVQQYSIADNQVLNSYYRGPFAICLKRNPKAVREHSKQLIAQFDIAAAGPWVAAATLSGGNQQKVILSRELSRDICFLVANQPTRGLDIGSLEFVHRQLGEIRDRGVAILLISVELDEIMSLSDRIAVMVAGKIAAVFDARHVSRQQLGLIMTGAQIPPRKTLPPA